MTDAVALREQEFEQNGRPVSVLLMDVDHFKKFNDTHGHQAGDEVLRGVARALRQAMRDVDLVARYGGEEFAVVFPGTGLEESRPAAERARAAIESAAFPFEGKQLKVTASVGIAQLRHGEGIAQTVKRADDALYASKKAGRNQAQWHDGETSHPVVHAVEAKAEAAATPAPQPATPPASAGLDPQTGLAMRGAFAEDVIRRLAEWKRGDSSLSLILIGVDGLPNLAEQFGAAAPETYYKRQRNFSKPRCATWTTSRGTIMTRSPCSCRQRISRLRHSVAERLRQAIARCELTEQGSRLSFTVSLGVTEAHHSDDGSAFMNRAEAALADARNDGSGCTRTRAVQAIAKPVAAG